MSGRGGGWVGWIVGILLHTWNDAAVGGAPHLILKMSASGGGWDAITAADGRERWTGYGQLFLAGVGDRESWDGRGLRHLTRFRRGISGRIG